MSTPLFIRTPKSAGKHNATASTDHTLFSAVGEPLLIEKVRFVAGGTATSRSGLTIKLHDPTANEDINIAHFVIAATGADEIACLDEDVDICIPEGWGLKVTHSLHDGGGVIGADVSVHGGFVR